LRADRQRSLCNVAVEHKLARMKEKDGDEAKGGDCCH
jgi:hypothetical protein